MSACSVDEIGSHERTRQHEVQGPLGFEAVSRFREIELGRQQDESRRRGQPDVAGAEHGGRRKIPPCRLASHDDPARRVSIEERAIGIDAIVQRGRKGMIRRQAIIDGIASPAKIFCLNACVRFADIRRHANISPCPADAECGATSQLTLLPPG